MLSKKKLLLIGGNFYPELTGIGKYNGEMINWLSQNGYQCTVITTHPYYPEWKVHQSYEKKSWWFCKENNNKTTIYRCPHYIPSSPSGTKRLISDFSFCLSASLVMLSIFFKRKYSCVVTVVPSFPVGLLGLWYKKLRGAKFIYHIQDLQIDAARDLLLVRSNFVLNSFFKIEKTILKYADVITTISEGMQKKLSDKCNKEIALFPNWTDTELFYPLVSKIAIKEKYGFKRDDKIILYSGAIGLKQGLELLIHAAKHFEFDKRIQFIICGTGPYKTHLLTLKDSLQANNVTFMPLQPNDEFNEFLNIADLHLVLLKSGARDLVMPSKLTNILSVGGVPIITADKDTTLYNLVKSTNMGVVIEPENEEQLVQAIKELTDKQIEEMGKLAREYAIQHLSKDIILQKFAAKNLPTVASHKTEAEALKKPIGKKVINGAIVGLGKMGLSHAAIIGSNSTISFTAACDTSSFILEALKTYTGINTYSDFRRMLDKEALDFIIIATPTKSHYEMIRYAAEKGIHVFCEKPFTLRSSDGETLLKIVKEKKLINQVGYHNHFIGTFRELKRLVKGNVLGEITSFKGEAYGPVVVKQKGNTWRSKQEEGGGCLYDYASHVINLIQEIIAPAVNVKGAVLKSIYSNGVEDEVFSVLELENKITGLLCVNWSDETYRKMSTTLTVEGVKGKVVCDATEIKVYLKDDNAVYDYKKGWTIKHITDFHADTNYYLRGEEYSAQIDYFINNILNGKQGTINTFEQSLHTDKAIEMIMQNANSSLDNRISTKKKSEITSEVEMTI